MQKTVFVTGATGLLGYNLVHQLVKSGAQVRALVRSRAKAESQFGDLPVQIVEGDMQDVAAFASQLHGVDELYHAAAYFRDSYKGGAHWEKLQHINVTCTIDLLTHAYAAGVRRLVHISSVATIKSAVGAVGKASDRRAAEGESDDYFRSKILADLAVEQFLEAHPEMWGAFVLPGFMNGPGDLGPTSAGQMLLDFAHRRLPGVMDAGLSFVDARDVAEVALLVMRSGQRGERVLAAGRYQHMREAYAVMAQVSGVPAPRLALPFWILFLYAAGSELFARVSGRPVLLSWSGAMNLYNERHRSRFESARAEALGVTFRPLEETLRDALSYYAQRGLVPTP